ncbi:sulfatase [Reichenbachiella sp. MALMAid0571]|uniref:sulfatase n=1 Tax=Reichenbachiella sp. MALMAid0571 TaxID=3143939 RepID=UPI0032DF2E91
MICIDDLNDWIGCMGENASAITPNIDRLASQGTLFTNAHCQTALCGPSRASIMSGLRPSTSGVYGQIKDNDVRTASSAMEGIKFLPEYFGMNGYKTMGIGKIFHGHAPDGVFQQSGGREGGFGPKPEGKKRFHWDNQGTSTDWGAFPDADEKMPDYNSAHWAMDRLNEKHDKPFFLTVGFVRPHVPWYVPQKWFDMHPLDQIQLPPYKKDDKDDLPEMALKVDELAMMPTTDWAIETNQWKDIVQAYLASTTFVDYYVGEVLKALENSPYKDNTIVVLWSDHGYRLGEKGTFAKHCMWQEGTNVPLIVKTPSGVGGSKNNNPVELLDIYPTLLDLCGLPPNSSNEGTSLKSLLDNSKSKWKDAAVTTFGRNNHAVVTEEYRYIRYENGAEELYDRAVDPNEWDNLANKPETGGIKLMLQKYLPKTNALWSPKSSMKHNPYFIKNMAENSASK